MSQPWQAAMGNDNQEDIASQKAKLRREFRAARVALPAEVRQQASATIARKLLELPILNAVQRVYTYLAFGGEVETQALIRDLLRRGKQIYVPEPDHSQHPLTNIHEVVLLADGGLSDASHSPDTHVSAIDLFIVPGIVWDRQGYRIGFGGGYFDRLLAAARPDALKVGLAYETQVIDSIPHEQWDIPVDLLITDSNVHIRKEGGFSNPPPLGA